MITLLRNIAHWTYWYLMHVSIENYCSCY